MTGVSGVRGVLTEALREHRSNVYQSGEEWAVHCEGCSWHDYGFFGDDAENEALWAHDDHVADVLLSLPGVAVVQLPEPDRDWATHNAWTADESYVVAAVDGRVIIEDEETVTSVDTETATRLAQGLLAAVAEGLGVDGD